MLRFVRASLKGWTYAVENPAEMPALVGQYLAEADAATENAKMVASLPLVNTGEDHIGWMRPEVWAAMEQTLRTQGVLTKPLDVTQVYTMQFLEMIYPRMKRSLRCAWQDMRSLEELPALANSRRR